MNLPSKQKSLEEKSNWNEMNGADRKIAIVTGAARGIGKATSLKFKNEGITVIETDILPDPETKEISEIYGKKLEAKTGEYSLDQKNCRYEPHIISMPVDSELKIHSSDPFNHNIHTYSFDNDPINIMFIPNQEEYSQEMEEAEIIKVECDLHSWMTAWIVVTPNSYSALSGDNGTFKILNVPSGNYKLTAWHETLGSLTKNITIENEDVDINFDLLEVTQEEARK